MTDAGCLAGRQGPAGPLTKAQRQARPSMSQVLAGCGALSYETAILLPSVRLGCLWKDTLDDAGLGMGLESRHGAAFSACIGQQQCR